MAKLNFASQVSDWVAQSKVAMTGVFRESCQRITEEMQKTRAEGGNMPVDTGFLRASLTASKETMPQIQSGAKPADGGSYAYDPGPVSLVIDTLELGDTLYEGYVANYAGYVNYGTSKTPARLFVEMAAQQWPQIVKQAEADLAAAIK